MTVTAGGVRRRPAPDQRVRHTAQGASVAPRVLLAAASWGDARLAATTTSSSIAPELARRSVSLDRLADVLSERAFVLPDPDLSDGPACVRASFGAPVGGGTIRPRAAVVRRCGARRRGTDATILAACWETVEQARVHARNDALAPVGTATITVMSEATRVRGLPRLRIRLPKLRIPRLRISLRWLLDLPRLLVRRTPRPSRERLHTVLRGGLMVVGVVAGVRWALPLQGVEGRCPPSGEGYGYCYLQKSVLPSVILFIAPVLGAQALGSFSTRTAPELVRRWRAGERPTRMTASQAAPPYTEDPVLLAASWGVKTGSDAADR